MRLRITPEASRELDEIWLWNCRRYGPDHADTYGEFLEEQMRTLQDDPLKGDLVVAAPPLRRLLMRHGKSGHGHVAIYSLEQGEVCVQHVFHTAQNWQSRLSP